ncbi:methyltransferase [Streptomyces sp. NEAU-Y11]|uniref:methyltransferase n=1 Tax=Streptomyces cucumeris TaxID=2962890 RepID=UPI0020C84F74|nr:methyltransferase [Streptomyces sp. NEAU-Y11]MCP9211179.1 hypothetical protein [Streptomyces sp. NEAU-Y11]
MKSLEQERRRIAELFDIAPSRVLHALAVLGVADLVGPDGTGAQALEEELGLGRENLWRLLRAAEALGVLTVDAEGGVRLLTAGTLLKTDHPGSLRAEFSDNALFTAWGPFVDCLRNGTPSYELSHGAPIFARMDDSPEELRQFHEHMRVRATQLYRPLLPHLLERCADDPVDLGGGTGGLSVLLLDASPTLQVTLTDLPAVIELIPETVRNAYPGRLVLSTGDMFTTVPAAHGTYLLGSVLHDWSDVRASELLTRCARALPEHGEIILLERVLDETGPDTRRMSDMWMMAMTGGRERSESEWAALARRSGLELREVHHGSGELAAITLSLPGADTTVHLKESAR